MAARSYGADGASRHFAITPSDSTVLGVATRRPRGIYVTVAGNLVMEDDLGVTVTYAVTAGQFVSFSPAKVKVGTTATVVGWY